MATNLADWHELAGGITESGDRTSTKAVVKYLGPWLERFDFVHLMFGGGMPYLHQVLDDPTWNYYNSIRPVSWNAVAYKGAQQQQQTRTRGGLTLSLYDIALVTIAYALPTGAEPAETDPEDPRGRGDVISERLDTSSEFLTMDEENFEWSDGTALTEKEAPGRLLVGLEYVFTRHAIDLVPPEAYTLVEHINSESLRALSGALAGKDFAPGTLLYRGCSLARSEDVFGDQTKQSISYRFGIRERRNPGEPDKVHGWNSFWRANPGKYDTIRAKGETASTPVFPAGDLTVL